MSGSFLIFRTDKHGYTRSETPWILGLSDSGCGKLVRYLSGGGLQTFGRTVGQEEARRKHIRFLVKAGVLATLWLVFYFV